MSARRFRRALAASALVHVAVLSGLLALPHPRFRSAPSMRVALVGHAGASAGPDRSEEVPGGTHHDGALAERAQHPAPVADPGVAGPSRPQPARSSTRAARPPEVRRSGGEEPGVGASQGVEALVSAVQSDVWVLSGSTPAPARGSSRPGASVPGAIGASSGTGAAPASSPGVESSGTSDGTGTDSAGDGQSSASLLAALSQRLAWSAARCAPPALVRTSRHAVPGVPLHFCLDAAGRPS
ncbi:MAG TPA: hypothetical protein VFN91_08100, partial [Myxococcaceae bacterium]|nr:hypothetical protein [Myxococcaceae bacterium]